jgi:hypothetical protein
VADLAELAEKIGVRKEGLAELLGWGPAVE